MSHRSPIVVLICPQCQKSFGVRTALKDRKFCTRACCNIAKKLPDGLTFWAKVNKQGPLPDISHWTLGNCWLWQAYTTKRGYGVFSRTDGPQKSYPVRAHRWSYEQEIGLIPIDRPQLDHLCRVRNCVRPTHLEPVTGAENIRRGLTGKWQVKCK